MILIIKRNGISPKAMLFSVMKYRMEESEQVGLGNVASSKKYFGSVVNSPHNALRFELQYFSFASTIQNCLKFE